MHFLTIYIYFKNWHSFSLLNLKFTGNSLPSVGNVGISRAIRDYNNSIIVKNKNKKTAKTQSKDDKKKSHVLFLSCKKMFFQLQSWFFFFTFLHFSYTISRMFAYLKKKIFILNHFGFTTGAPCFCSVFCIVSAFFGKKAYLTAQTDPNF